MALHGSTDREPDEKSKLGLLIKVWSLVGIILLIIAATYALGALLNAITLIAWTAIFVFILRGPVNWFEKKGINRTIGTLLAYIVFIAFTGLLVFVIFSPVFGLSAQFEDIAKSFPSYVQALEDWTNSLYDRYSSILQNDNIKSWISNASGSVASAVQSVAAGAASGVVSAGASVASVAMCIMFALVISFWMLVDLPRLGKEAYRIIEKKYHSDANIIYLTVTHVLGGYIRATAIQCTIIGLICGILFAILNIPSPAAFGVITGLLNIIPIVGPWLGGGLAFAASLSISPIIATIALIGTIVLQQVVYTFVSPKLMAKSVDIHPALTFVALVAGSGVGATLGGLIGSLVGALIAIPLAAIIKTLFVYYFEKKTKRRIVSEDGVFFKGNPLTDEGKIDPVADATEPIANPELGQTGKLKGITDRFPHIKP